MEIGTSKGTKGSQQSRAGDRWHRWGIGSTALLLIQVGQSSWKQLKGSASCSLPVSTQRIGVGISKEWRIGSRVLWGVPHRVGLRRFQSSGFSCRLLEPFLTAGFCFPFPVQRCGQQPPVPVCHASLLERRGEGESLSRPEQDSTAQLTSVTPSAASFVVPLMSEGLPAACPESLNACIPAQRFLLPRDAPGAPGSVA